MVTGRVIWRDTARGVGILLVVFGHIERGMTASGLANGSWWEQADFALYTFHMPLFMLLAGMNAARSSRPQADAERVRGKLLSILYPYFLWSLILGAVMVAMAGHSNTQLATDSLWKIGWSPIGPMWFLYVLFLYSIAAIFLPFRVLAAFAILAFPTGDLFGKDTVVHQILHFALFYVLGMGTVQYLDELKAGWIMAVLSLAAVAAATWLAAWLHVKNYNLSFFLPAALLGSLAVIALAKQVASAEWLARLGRLSMPVYIFHQFVGPMLRVALGTRLVPLIGSAVFAVVLTSLSVLLSLVSYVVLRKLGLLSWAGLRPGISGTRWIRSGTLLPGATGDA